LESLEAVNQARTELLNEYGIAKGLNGVTIAGATKSDLPPMPVNYATSAAGISPLPTVGKPKNDLNLPRMEEFSAWLQTQKKGNKKPKL